jgi:hypothetical protein
MATESLREAIRYWEPRRIWFNLALSALAAAWVAATWPHFQHALTLLQPSFHADEIYPSVGAA